MPYRAANLLVALAGLVAVAGLVIVGADVYLASRRGPRWKRRLIGAGLAVAGMLGAWFARPRPSQADSVMSCYAPAPACIGAASDLRQRLPLLEKMVEQDRLDPEVARKSLIAAQQDLGRLGEVTEASNYPWMSGREMMAIREATRPVVARLREKLGEPSRLEDSAEWKVLSATWAEATAVLARNPKPGEFAFDAETKSRLTRSVGELLEAGLDRLVGADLLAPGESRLLTADLKDLLDGLQRLRTSGNDTAPTCYGPNLPMPAAKSAWDLDGRLAAIKEMVATADLHPIVIEKVLVSVEQDLAVLADPASYVGMAPYDRAKAERIRDEVKAAIEKLKARLAENQKR